MLFVKPCEDSELLKQLSKEIFKDWLVFNGNLVCYENNTPIGICNFTISDDTFQIRRIGILPEFRAKGRGDFFTRVVISKALDYDLPITTYKSQYFLKFGFQFREKDMFATADSVSFPSCCGCQ